MGVVPSWSYSRGAMSIPSAASADVDRIGGGAHGEEETSRPHVLPDRARHRLLLFRYLLEAESRGDLLAQYLLLYVPIDAPVPGVELSILAREILVVEVEPVVFLELSREHLLVVHDSCTGCPRI